MPGDADVEEVVDGKEGAAVDNFGTGFTASRLGRLAFVPSNCCGD